MRFLHNNPFGAIKFHLANFEDGRINERQLSMLLNRHLFLREFTLAAKGDDMRGQLADHSDKNWYDLP